MIPTLASNLSLSSLSSWRIASVELANWEDPSVNLVMGGARMVIEGQNAYPRPVPRPWICSMLLPFTGTHTICRPAITA